MRAPTLADHLTYWSKIAAIISATNAVIITLIIYVFKRWKARSQEKKLAQDLRPFFTKMEVEAATQFYVPTRIQVNSPTEGPEPDASGPNRQEAIPWFKKRIVRMFDGKEAGRFFLLLADSGMGKTTFLINLVMACSGLRSFKQVSVKLLPLNNAEAFPQIDTWTLDDRKNTVLLLDAFDEDTLALQDYKSRLTDIVSRVSQFPFVIITCRTQFFESAAQIPTETHLRSSAPSPSSIHFQRLFIAPFDEQDVDLYLEKRFPVFHWKQRKKARGVVDRASRLMSRPMLLAHVEDLVKSDRKYSWSVEIYEEMVIHWLKRESIKIADPDLGVRLRSFSYQLAINLWVHRIERKGLHAWTPDIASLAAAKDIDLHALTERDISTRSLLIRTSDGRVKFAHKSILEYFLARAAFDDLELALQLQLAEYDSLDQLKHFIRERLLVPSPDGYFESTAASVIFNNMYYKDAAVPEFMVIKDEPHFALVCSTNTPPELVRMMGLLGHPFAVHLCYRPFTFIRANLAEKWAQEVAAEPNLTEIQIRGTQLSPGTPLKEEFDNVFRTNAIFDRLRYPHIDPD